jgi:hypothetical protein
LAITLNLWAPNFDGSILLRKFELDPKRCNGHTATDGRRQGEDIPGVESKDVELEHVADAVSYRRLADFSGLAFLLLGVEF